MSPHLIFVGKKYPALLAMRHSTQFSIGKSSKSNTLICELNSVSSKIKGKTFYDLILLKQIFEVRDHFI